jgi:hypothetical protein
VRKAVGKRRERIGARDDEGEEDDIEKILTRRSLWQKSNCSAKKSSNCEQTKGGKSFKKTPEIGELSLERYKVCSRDGCPKGSLGRTEHAEKKSGVHADYSMCFALLSK